MEKPPAWPKWLGGIGLSLGILGASFYGYQTATAEKAVALDLSERAPMATRANAGEVLSWVGKMAMVKRCPLCCFYSALHRERPAIAAATRLRAHAQDVGVS